VTHLNPPCRDTVAGEVTTYLRRRASVDRANLQGADARTYWTVTQAFPRWRLRRVSRGKVPVNLVQHESASRAQTGPALHVDYAIAHYFDGNQAAFNAHRSPRQR
jgi:hypothetical protein